MSYLRKEEVVDKLNMKLTLEVEGKEDVGFTLSYKGTDLKTVLLVENALKNALGSLLEGQAEKVK